MLNPLRSRPAALLSLALLALPVAACSGANSAGTAEGGATTEKRTVQNVEKQNVEVPADPKRVVTLSEPTLDGALALGVTPVGTISGRGQKTAPAYLGEQAQSIKVVGAVAQPNLEAIKALDPDLILVDGTSINNNPPMLETLGQIAPVVNTGLAGGDWKANFTVTADALNKSDAGEKVLNDYSARVRTVKGNLGPNRDATISIVRWQGSGPSLILKELIPGRVVTDLGLRRPPAQNKEGRGHSEPISSENIAEIDADWVFLGSLGGSSVANPKGSGATGKAVSEQAIKNAAIDVPGFMELKAFQQQHIVPVDGAVWTSTGGPTLVNKVLDDLEQTLTTKP